MPAPPVRRAARAGTAFFSAAGRASFARLALAFALAAPIVRWSAPVFGYDSFPAYAAGGALWGAILAKLTAETGRRLRDAGWGGWAGWLLFAALLLVPYDAFATMGFDWRRPPQAAAIAVGAVLLLRPGGRGPSRWGDRPPLLLPTFAPGDAGLRRAASFAAISIGGGLLLACAMLAWSHGLRAAHERTMRWVEQHRDDPPPPEPFR